MTMIARIASQLWETNFARTVDGPKGITEVSWEALCFAARSDPIAKAWFDRVRQQAYGVLEAMRDPTEHMIAAGLLRSVTAPALDDVAEEEKRRWDHHVRAVYEDMIGAAIAEG